MLEITNMLNKDSLFYFQAGLKDWSKVELDMCSIQSLDDAIVVTESLANYFVQPKDKRPNQNKSWEDSQKDKGHNCKDWGQNSILTARVGKVN